jgi:dynein heavy chain
MLDDSKDLLFKLARNKPSIDIEDNLNTPNVLTRRLSRKDSSAEEDKETIKVGGSRREPPSLSDMILAYKLQEDAKLSTESVSTVSESADSLSSSYRKNHYEIFGERFPLDKRRSIPHEESQPPPLNRLGIDPARAELSEESKQIVKIIYNYNLMYRRDSEGSKWAEMMTGKPIDPEDIPKAPVVPKVKLRKLFESRIEGTDNNKKKKVAKEGEEAASKNTTKKHKKKKKKNKTSKTAKNEKVGRSNPNVVDSTPLSKYLSSSQVKLSKEEEFYMLSKEKEEILGRLNMSLPSQNLELEGIVSSVYDEVDLQKAASRPQSGWRTSRALPKPLSRPVSAQRQLGKHLSQHSINENLVDNNQNPNLITSNDIQIMGENTFRIEQLTERKEPIVQGDTLSDATSIDSFSRLRKEVREKVGTVQNFDALFQSASSFKPKQLPLDYFDNLDYETKKPEQWLQLGKEKGLVGTPAISRYYFNDGLGDEWEWLPCYVIDYLPETEEYLIQWKNSSKIKRVRRLNLMFDEDRRDYLYIRLEYAVKLRSAYEDLLAYSDTIHKLPYDDRYTPFPLEWKNRIVRRTGIFQLRKRHATFFKRQMGEVIQDYIFSMKKTDFDRESKYTVLSSITATSERFAKVVSDTQRTLTKPEDPMANVLYKKVLERSTELSSYMFIANANTQKAITEIVLALRRVLDAKESFFRKPFSIPIPFYNFLAKMESHSELVQAKLVHEWPVEVAKIIKHYLSEFFNFKEENESVYRRSRCYDFLQMINLVIEEQLKNEIITGLKSLLSLFSITTTSTLDKKLTIDPVQTRMNPNLMHEEIKGDNVTYSFLLPTPQSVPPLFLTSITLSVFINEVKYETVDLDKIVESFIPIPGYILSLVPHLSLFDDMLLSIYEHPRTLTKGTIRHIERLVMDRIDRNSDDPGRWVKTIDEEDRFYVEGRNIMMQLVKRSYKDVEALLNQYKKYEYLIQENIQVLPEFTNKSTPLLWFSDMLAKYSSAAKAILFISADVVPIPPLVIQCDHIKKLFMRLVSVTINAIKSVLSERIQKKCQTLVKNYKLLNTKILVNPFGNTDKWKLLNNNLKNAENDIQVQSTILNEVKAIWDLLYDYGIYLPQDIIDLYWSTLKWPTELQNNLLHSKDMLQDAQMKHTAQIRIDIGYINQSTEAYILEIQEYKDFYDLKYIHHMVERVRLLRERIDKLRNLSISVVDRQVCLSEPQTAFEALDAAIKEFSGYESFWLLADELRRLSKKWLDSYFMDLDAGEVQKKVFSWQQVISNLKKTFTSNRRISVTLIDLQEQLDDFNRHMIIITSLRNPALKPRHWEILANTVGISLSEFNNLSLRQVMGLDLELVHDLIWEVSEKATEEHKLEIVFEEIRRHLSHNYFQIRQFGKCYLLDNIEDAISAYEDHLMRINSLKVGYIDAKFQQRIDSWCERLVRSQETLELWSDLQRLFIILYPVFKTPGMAYILREEYDNFMSVTKLTFVLMDILSKNQKWALILVRSDLQDIIGNALAKLEKTIKRIHVFLETKRNAYTRFYFLSDMDMLELLPGTVDVGYLGANIFKLFDAVHGLEFHVDNGDNIESGSREEGLESIFDRAVHVDKKGSDSLDKKSDFKNSNHLDKETSTAEITSAPALEVDVLGASSKIELEKSVLSKATDPSVCSISITALNGFYGERLELSRPIKVDRKVEEWLKDLQESITLELTDHTRNALHDFDTSPDFSYFANYALQAILLTFQIYWTKELSEIITNHEENNYTLRDAKRNIQKMLDHLISWVREQTLSYQVQACLLVVVCYLNHLIDVLDSLHPLDYASSLEWKNTACFKFRVQSDPFEVAVEHMQYRTEYGFEYLGSPERIVIHPLTARFFRYMGDAMHSFYPAAFCGPAGVGKTETVLEFSRMLGKRCFIFQVHQDTHVSLLSNAIHGLLQCNNVFVCLENLHKLETFSLNYFSRTLLDILKSVLAAVRGRRTFVTYSGKEYTLVREYGLFFNITSKGIHQPEWKQLPTYLKSFLRPYAATPPSKVVIIEWMLLGLGFRNAKQFAKKIGAVLEFASKMLLSGRTLNSIRVTKAVLNVIQKLSLKNRTLDEQAIVYRAVEKVVLSQIQLNEVHSFMDVLELAFSSNDVTREDHSNLKSFIYSAAEKEHIQPSEAFVQKVCALCEALQSRQKVLILGPAGCGKTTHVQILRDALQSATSSIIKVLVLVPGSLTSKELFGEYVRKTGESKEGKILKYLRELGEHCRRTENVSTESSGNGWLVLDGEIDKIVSERLFDTCGHHINSSEGSIVPIGKGVKIIFESNSTGALSPASLATAAMVMVNFGEWNVHSTVYMHAQSLPEPLQRHSETIQSIFNYLIDPIYKLLKEEKAGQPCCFIKSSLTRNAFLIFKALFDDFGLKGYYRLTEAEQVDWMVAQVLFSTLWGVGGTCLWSVQKKIDVLCRELLKNNILQRDFQHSDNILPFLKNSTLFPDGDVLYAYYYDTKRLRWLSWSSLSPEILSDWREFGTSELVVTTEMQRNAFLQTLLGSRGYPVLVCGGPQSGKTSLVQGSLMLEYRNLIGKKNHAFTLLEFPVTKLTRGDSLKARIDKELTRVQLRTLGKKNKRPLIAFVDDIHDASEEGDVNLHDVLREWLTYGGYHAHLAQGVDFYHLRDTRFVGTFSILPNRPITDHKLRLLRQVVCLPLDDRVDERALNLIGDLVSPSFAEYFGKMLAFDMVSCLNTFMKSLKAKVEIDSFDKSHYVFGLKDIFRILHTTMNWLSVQQEDIGRLKFKLFHAFGHAAYAAILDKLVNKEEVAAASEFLDSSMHSSVLVRWNLICTPSDPLIYFPPLGGETSDKVAMPVKEIGPLIQELDGLVRKSSTKNIPYSWKSLYLLNLEGITMADRILLVGTHGRGHNLILGANSAISLNATEMVAQLCDYKVITSTLRMATSDTASTLAEWREMLRDLFNEVIQKDTSVFFHINDDDIRENAQWEDILVILKKGFIPDLFGKSERLRLTETVLKRENAFAQVSEDRVNYNAELQLVCRKNIHLVISINSVRGMSKRTTNVLPALIPECFVHWTRNWSMETTSQVVRMVVNHSQLLSHEVDKVCTFLVERYYDYRKYMQGVRWDMLYSPSSLIDYLRCFQELFKLRLPFLDELMYYRTGIEKTLGAIKAVKDIEEKLDSAKAKVEQNESESRDFMTKLADAQNVSQKRKAEIQRLQSILSKLNQEISSLKSFHTSETSSVIMPLNNAIRNIEVQKNDFYDLKSMVNPPKEVQLVLEAVGIIFRLESKYSENAWEAGKRFMLDPRFIQNVFNFDKDNLPTTLMHRLESYTRNPEFNPAIILRYSRVLSFIAAWILAIDKYHRVMLKIQPKMKHLQEVETQKETHMKIMTKETKKLETAEETLKQLQMDFDRVIHEREEARRCHEEWDGRYIKAKLMLDVLYERKEAWTQKLELLERKLQTWLGNCVLASSRLIFLDCNDNITEERKRTIVEGWGNALQDLGIKHSDHHLSFFFSSFSKTEEALGIKLETTIDHYCFMYLWKFKLLSYWTFVHDPFEEFLTWLRVIDRNRKFCIINSSEAQYSVRIARCMREGQLCVLNLQSLVSVNEDLLHLIRQYKKAQFGIRGFQLFYMHEEIYVPKAFGLLIISTIPLELFPEELSATCYSSVYHLCSDKSLIMYRDALYDTRTDIAGRSNLPEVRRQMMEEIVKRKKRIVDFESKIYDLLLSISTTDVVGGYTYEAVLESRRAIVDMEDKIKKFEQDILELDQQFHNIDTLFVFCHDIKVLISSLWKVNIIYQFNSDVLHQLFKKTLLKTESSSLHEFAKAYCRSVFFFAENILNEQDVVLLSFSLMIKFRQYFPEEGLDSKALMPGYFIEMLLHSRADLSKVSFMTGMTKKTVAVQYPQNLKGWLSPDHWTKLQELSKLPRFATLCADVVRYGNRNTTPLSEPCFEDYYYTVETKSHKLPASWGDLGAPDRALLTSCMRREDIYSICESLTDEYFDHTLLDPPLHENSLIQIDELYNLSNPTIPILLFPHEYAQVEDFFRNYAKVKGMENCINVVRLNSEFSDHDLHAMADEAVLKGRWILVQSCELHFEWLMRWDTHLRDYLDSKRDKFDSSNGFHPEFRLWISVEEPQHLPSTLAHYGLKIMLRHPLHLRNLVENTIQIMEQQLNPHEFPPSFTYRDLLFRFCSFHSVLLERTSFNKAGARELMFHNDSSLLQGIYDLRSIFQQSALDAITLEKDRLKNIIKAIYMKSYEDRFLFLSDKRELSFLLSEHLHIDWKGTDSASVRLKTPLPFKGIYDAMHKNLFNVVQRKAREIPRQASMYSSGMSDVAIYSRKQELSQKIVDGLRKVFPSSLEPLVPNDSFPLYHFHQHFDFYVSSLVEDLNPKLYKHLFYNDSPTKNLTTADIDFHVSSAHKHLDRLLLKNIAYYRRLYSIVLDSLQRIMAGMEPVGPYGVDGNTLHECFKRNIIPECWLPACYETNLKFKDFLMDLEDRLKYTKMWYDARHTTRMAGGKDTVLFHDITRLFVPSELFYGTLLATF